MAQAASSQVTSLPFASTTDPVKSICMTFMARWNGNLKQYQFIEDGSGEIDVKRAGSVRVSDGSGGISVADVAGDFVVTDDGSGDVEYDNVRGHIDVPMRHHHRDR